MNIILKIFIINTFLYVASSVAAQSTSHLVGLENLTNDQSLNDCQATEEILENSTISEENQNMFSSLLDVLPQLSGNGHQLSSLVPPGPSMTLTLEHLDCFPTPKKDNQEFCLKSDLARFYLTFYSLKLEHHQDQILQVIRKQINDDMKSLIILAQDSYKNKKEKIPLSDFKKLAWYFSQARHPKNNILIFDESNWLNFIQTSLEIRRLDNSAENDEDLAAIIAIALQSPAITALGIKKIVEIIQNETVKINKDEMILQALASRIQNFPTPELEQDRAYLLGGLFQLITQSKMNQLAKNLALDQVRQVAINWKLDPQILVTVKVLTEDKPAPDLDPLLGGSYPQTPFRMQLDENDSTPSKGEGSGRVEDFFTNLLGGLVVPFGSKKDDFKKADDFLRKEIREVLKTTKELQDYLFTPITDDMSDRGKLVTRMENEDLEDQIIERIIDLKKNKHKFLGFKEGIVKTKDRVIGLSNFVILQEIVLKQLQKALNLPRLSTSAELDELLLKQVAEVTKVFGDCIEAAKHDDQKVDGCAKKIQSSLPYRIGHQLIPILLRENMASQFQDQDGKLNSEGLDRLIVGALNDYDQCSENHLFLTAKQEEIYRQKYKNDFNDLQKLLGKKNQSAIGTTTNGISQEDRQNVLEVPVMNPLSMVQGCVFFAFLNSTVNGGVIDQALSSSLGPIFTGQTPEEKKQLISKVTARVYSCLENKGLLKNGQPVYVNPEKIKNLYQQRFEILKEYHQFAESLQNIYKKDPKKRTEKERTNLMVWQLREKDIFASIKKIDEDLVNINPLTSMDQNEFVDSLKEECTVKIALDEVIRFFVNDNELAKNYYREFPAKLDQVINQVMALGLEQCLATQQQVIDQQMEKVSTDFHRGRFIEGEKYNGSKERKIIREIKSKQNMGHCIDLIKSTALGLIFSDIINGQSIEMFNATLQDVGLTWEEFYNDPRLSKLGNEFSLATSQGLAETEKCFENLRVSALKYIQDHLVLGKITEAEQIHCLKLGIEKLASGLVRLTIELKVAKDQALQDFAALITPQIKNEAILTVQNCFGSYLKKAENFDQLTLALDNAKRVCAIDAFSSILGNLLPIVIEKELKDKLKPEGNETPEELSDLLTLQKSLKDTFVDQYLNQNLPRKIKEIKEKITDDNMELLTGELTQDLKAEAIWFFANQLIGDKLVDMLGEVKNANSTDSNNGEKILNLEQLNPYLQLALTKSEQEAFKSKLGNKNYAELSINERPLGLISDQLSKRLMEAKTESEMQLVLDDIIFTTTASLAEVILNKEIGQLIIGNPNNQKSVADRDKLVGDLVTDLKTCLAAASNVSGMAKSNECLSNLLKQAVSKITDYILYDSIFSMVDSSINDELKRNNIKAEMETSFKAVVENCMATIPEKVKSRLKLEIYMPGERLSEELAELNVCADKIKRYAIEYFGGAVVQMIYEEMFPYLSSEQVEIVVERVREDVAFIYQIDDNVGHIKNFVKYLTANDIVNRKLSEVVEPVFNYDQKKLKENLVKYQNMFDQCLDVYVNSAGEEFSYLAVKDKLTSGQKAGLDQLSIDYDFGKKFFQADYLKQIGYESLLFDKDWKFDARFNSCLVNFLGTLLKDLIKDTALDYGIMFDQAFQDKINHIMNACIEEKNLKLFSSKTIGADFFIMNPTFSLNDVTKAYLGNENSCKELAIQEISVYIENFFIEKASAHMTAVSKLNNELMDANSIQTKQELLKSFIDLGMLYGRNLERGQDAGMKNGLGPPQLLEYFDRVAAFMANGVIKETELLTNDIRSLEQSVKEAVAQGKSFSIDEVVKSLIKSKKEKDDVKASGVILNLLKANFIAEGKTKHSARTELFLDELFLGLSKPSLFDRLSLKVLLAGNQESSETSTLKLEMGEIESLAKTVLTTLEAIADYQSESDLQPISSQAIVYLNEFFAQLEKVAGELTYPVIVNELQKSNLFNHAKEAIIADSVKKGLTSSFTNLFYSQLDSVLADHQFYRPTYEGIFIEEILNEKGERITKEYNVDEVLKRLDQKYRDQFYDYLSDPLYSASKAYQYLASVSGLKRKPDDDQYYPLKSRNINIDIYFINRLEMNKKDGQFTHPFFRGLMDLKKDQTFFDLLPTKEMKHLFNRFPNDELATKLLTRRLMTEFQKPNSWLLKLNDNSDVIYYLRQAGGLSMLDLSKPKTIAQMRADKKLHEKIDEKNHQQFLQFWSVVGDDKNVKMVGSLARIKSIVDQATSQTVMGPLINSELGKRFFAEQMNPKIEKLLLDPDYDFNDLSHDLNSPEMMNPLTNLLISNRKGGSLVDSIAHLSMQDTIYAFVYDHAPSAMIFNGNFELKSMFTEENWAQISKNDKENFITNYFADYILKPSINSEVFDAKSNIKTLGKIVEIIVAQDDDWDDIQSEYKELMDKKN